VTFPQIGASIVRLAIEVRLLLMRRKRRSLPSFHVAGSTPFRSGYASDQSAYQDVDSDYTDALSEASPGQQLQEVVVPILEKTLGEMTTSQGPPPRNPAIHRLGESR
jgi:hypothetical protein